MGRGGFAARDGAAGAVQERTRQGGMKLTAPPEDEIPPWTLTGLGEGGAFTQPKSPRPRRRGLRGNMVPPSNRARPAVRCRTALPQKRRDFGGADRPAARGRIFRPRPRRKSPRRARNSRLACGGTFPKKQNKKSAPRGAFSLLFSFFRRRGRTSPGRSPRGHRSKPRPLSPCRCTA